MWRLYLLQVPPFLVALLLLLLANLLVRMCCLQQHRLFLHLCRNHNYTT